MIRARSETLVVLSLLVAGCATSHAPSARSASSSGSPVAEPPRRPSFKVTFKEGYAYAEEDGRSWRIAEVTRNEMLWAPDGMRFAYVLPVKRGGDGHPEEGSPVRDKAKEKDKACRKPEGKPEAEAYQIVIRNIRGDSVNAFAVYRPGKPTGLEWIDDRHISYEAPPDRSGNAYVMHAVDSGEILAVHRGDRFVWSPGKKRLAYISGRRRRQVIKVDNEQVWPRGRSRSQRQILSELVWSPNGAGLAFLERNGRKSRLVVLLVIDDKNGDLTWDLPKHASNGKNKLFWAESKVLIGESTFKPRFAASWTRLQ